MKANNEMTKRQIKTKHSLKIYNGDGKQIDGFEEAPDSFSGFVEIIPVPKGRPRFARIGRGVRAYSPKETEEYENAVRKWFKQEYGTNTTPMDGNLKATYEFLLPKPKSKSKNTVLANTKPDIDNLVKSFQDALDFKQKKRDIALGVINNDSRVTTLISRKRYIKDGEVPGIFFTITQDEL